MNTSVAPFDNPKVRQAVNLAIDRQALLETFGVPGKDSLGPPLGVGMWFSRSAEEIAKLPGWRQLNGKKHPDDIAKAKALLAEAGHPNGFKAEMMVSQVVQYPDQAPIYKEQLKKIGIDLDHQAGRQRDRVPALPEGRLGVRRARQCQFPGPARCAARPHVDADGNLGTLCQVRAAASGGRKPTPSRRASRTARNASRSCARWRTS